MSRQKGTPNKPKVDYVSQINEVPTELHVDITPLRVFEEKKTLPKYEIAIGYGEGSFTQVVNGLFDFGYECQGGVSVTNYRANDGSIVMVYAQAMVRRE